MKYNKISQNRTDTRTRYG